MPLGLGIGRARIRGNALKLRGCDFDGWRCWVVDLFVVGSFDGSVAGAVAFDDAGGGAVASASVGVFEDFGEDAVARPIKVCRGKSPRCLPLLGG